VQDTVSDYEILEKRLAEAERRLVDARAHVRRQKELIESLERDGLSVAAEFTTLKNLQMLVRKTETSSCVNCTSRHKLALALMVFCAVERPRRKTRCRTCQCSFTPR
jgi:hypothetical protein